MVKLARIDRYMSGYMCKILLKVETKGISHCSPVCFEAKTWLPFEMELGMLNWRYFTLTSGDDFSD